MENSKNKPVFFETKVWCTFFGHHFVTSRNVTNHFKEFKCKHCGLELTNDEKGQRTHLTPELRDINETLFHFYQKRHHLV